MINACDEIADDGTCDACAKPWERCECPPEPTTEQREVGRMLRDRICSDADLAEVLRLVEAT